MYGFPRPRPRVRPLAAGDERAVQAIFGGMSAASRSARYLAPLDRLSSAMLRALTAVDGDRHVALLAEVRVGRRWDPIGVARYVVDGPGRAEVAYEVVDAWQGRGVGSRLVRELVQHARERGVERLHATVRADNEASLALLRRALPDLRVRRDGAVFEVEGWLIERPLQLDDLFADLHAA
jgi:RimJ/RimL family protein N-acetyltransferase